MTEELYLKQLNKLRYDIQHKKIQKVLKLLEELFEWKPVRLRWYIVKAEALMAIGRWKEAIALLNSRYDFTYEEPDAVAYIECYKKWRLYLQDKEGADMLSHLQTMLTYAKTREAENPSEISEAIQNAEEQWIDDMDSQDTFEKLLLCYYVEGHLIEYFVLNCLYKKKWPDTCRKSPFFIESFLLNLWYLIEKLNESDPHTFSIITNKKEQVQTAYILALAISGLGHCPLLFTEGIPCEVNGNIALEETVNISMDNVEFMEQIKVIHPVDVIYENTVRSNLPYILDRIVRDSPDEIMMVLAPSYLLDHLIVHPVLAKNSARLGALQTYAHKDYYSFAYAGNYLTHLNDLYGIEVEKEINKEPACKFSIILPVRNNTDTLKYTLNTCITQRFEDYEIVVSDNSTDEHDEVASLIRSLNHPRISYYKTPCNLSLTKSFEFAYLKAKGEFLLSLGADDAILPWGLEALAQVIDKYPNEDIWCWDRGFYIWPSFPNSYQLGQFEIPGPSQKNQFKIQKWPSIDSLERLLEEPSTIYAEPLFYINSGFHRRYLKKLLERTGKLWFGYSQDVYMGIANLCINEYIMHLNYPITIAGMSGASIGVQASVKNEKSQESLILSEYFYRKDMCINYVETDIERECFIAEIDLRLIFVEMLKLDIIGILPKIIKEKLDIKKIYQKIMKGEFKQHAFCDRNVQFVRAALKNSEEEQIYLEENMCTELMRPARFAASSKTALCYSTGFTNSGGLTLDSRKFQVQNIEDAVSFFANIVNL